MSKKSDYAKHIHSDHGLTPIQAAVLQAFDDGEAHDRVTVANYLDGGHRLSRFITMRTVADDALRQLVMIGLVRVDPMGWHHLTARPSRPQPNQEATQ